MLQADGPAFGGPQLKPALDDLRALPMPQGNALALAVRAALADQVALREVSLENVSSLAGAARAANEEVIGFLAEQGPVAFGRAFIALQLIRASIDHARALLLLLETNPTDLSASALALHRAQIDCFLRGVFLGFIATEEEVEDFVSNDCGIRRKTDKGKPRNVGAKELAVDVERFIYALGGQELAESSKISTMVKNAWDPLCGFVHGGLAIHASYLTPSGEIGNDLPPIVLAQTIDNTFAISSFAFVVVIAQVYNLAGIPVDSPLSAARERFFSLRARIGVRS